MNKLMVNVNGSYVRVDDIRLIGKVSETKDEDAEFMKGKDGFIYKIKILELQGYMVSELFGGRKDAEKSRYELIKLIEDSNK